MIKNKSLIFISMVIVLLLSACATTTTNSSTTTVRQISVVGAGSVFLPPDIAYINVGVRSQADTVEEALRLNNNQAKAIKETLVSEGVEAKDIQTSSFNVYPQSEYDYQGQVTRTFYAVENNVYVTVRDLDAMSSTLGAVARSGANNIYGITFDVQDKTDAQSEARKMALDSARTQAKELAEAAGVQLGDIISITTTYYYPNNYAYGYGLGGGGGAAEYSQNVPITAGQTQVSSEVTVVYQIK